MTWLTSLLAALLSGIAGLVLTGFLANACVSWFSVSSREGAAGYFVIFLALGGGIAGFIIGLITARMVGAHYGHGFVREAGGALAVVLAIAGMATLLCRLVADVPPTLEGRELNLEAEFRFPAEAGAEKPPTTRGEWTFRLGSLAGHTQRTYRDGTIHSEAARLEEGRWIVPAEVFLFTERGRRVISLIKEGSDAGGFLVSLPARPGSDFEKWSDWLPRQQSGGQPWPADKLSYRFRVARVPLPPPQKTQAEHQAEDDALKEAAFAAIPGDAPVERWFPYLDYPQPQTERALSRIAGRAGLAAELGRLAAGDDEELASRALRCISMLPSPSTEFSAVVENAGRDLAERMRQVNATPAEADPSFEGAARISVRFSGWMTAARALRDKSVGSFTNELRTILELSRVRTESQVLRQDVCRVSSYYLHQWAGVEPLPTDPKPR